MPTDWERVVLNFIAHFGAEDGKILESFRSTSFRRWIMTVAKSFSVEVHERYL
jgi:hypothetical protein